MSADRGQTVGEGFADVVVGVGVTSNGEAPEGGADGQWVVSVVDDVEDGKI